VQSVKAGNRRSLSFFSSAYDTSGIRTWEDALPFYAEVVGISRHLGIFLAGNIEKILLRKEQTGQISRYFS